MSGQQATYLDQPLDHWVAMLDDADPLVRRLAVYALGEMGPGARSLAERLTEAVNDPEPLVRVWAAAALARVDPGNQDAIHTLLAATADPSDFVRCLGVWLLGRLGQDCQGIEQALPSLRGMLEDRDPCVCFEAQVALQKLQGRGRPPAEFHSVHG
jgi:HEAT repeat protein